MTATAPAFSASSSEMKVCLGIVCLQVLVFLQSLKLIYVMSVGVLPPRLCVHHMLAVPTEASRRHQPLWNWSYKQLWTTVWVLRIEAGSSGRVSSPLNHWATLPAPIYIHFKLCYKIIHIPKFRKELEFFGWTHSAGLLGGEELQTPVIRRKLSSKNDNRFRLLFICLHDYWNPK